MTKTKQALVPGELQTVTGEGEVALVHPDSGVVLILSQASTDDLADWKRAIGDWRRRADAAEAHVDAEIVARMDRNAGWTIRTASGALKSASPAPSVSYKEPERLRLRLQGLVDLGQLTQDALDEALPVVPEAVTVKPGKLGQLEKLGGSVAVEIRKARVERPKASRRVSLS